MNVKLKYDIGEEVYKIRLIKDGTIHEEVCPECSGKGYINGVIKCIKCENGKIKSIKIGGEEIVKAKINGFFIQENGKILYSVFLKDDYTPRCSNKFENEIFKTYEEAETYYKNVYLKNKNV